MAIEVFNRYEHKYLMDTKTYWAITKRIQKYMQADAYNIGGNCYTIANLYYDTKDNLLIRQSLSKPVYKEKLRLRSYGVPQSSSDVFLEIKKKFDGLVNKRRTILKPQEAYEFLSSNVPTSLKSYMNKQVTMEIKYFLSCYDLQAKTYIAYDRMAYFEKDNPDLRISFDTNIRTRRYDLRLECGDYGDPILDDGIWLMEVKTALAKPVWLCNIISEFGLCRTSFSKYGTEFKQQLGLEEKPQATRIFARAI